MTIELRDVAKADLETVHTLNERALPHVNRVSVEWLRQLTRNAPYFRLATREETVLGFLLGMTHETDYDSMNFQWFRERYPKFAYIDRIVVAEEARGRGVGQLLYEDICTFGRSFAPVLACEVNIRPPNESSLRFHERFGFEPVGQQDTEGGTKTVRLMTLPLATVEAAGA